MDDNLRKQIEELMGSVEIEPVEEQVEEQVEEYDICGYCGECPLDPDDYEEDMCVSCRLTNYTLDAQMAMIGYAKTMYNAVMNNQQYYKANIEIAKTMLAQRYEKYVMMGEMKPTSNLDRLCELVDAEEVELLLNNEVDDAIKYERLHTFEDVLSLGHGFLSEVIRMHVQDMVRIMVFSLPMLVNTLNFHDFDDEDGE